MLRKSIIGPLVGAARVFACCAFMVTAGAVFAHRAYAVESIYYPLTDHLGSTAVVADSAGNIVAENDYFPFGESRVEESSPQGLDDHKYTGQEKDEEIGLYYYNARYYHPDLGRFVSADPVDGDLTAPQSLNKHSYTVNNPIKYVDPSGLYKVETGEIEKGDTESRIVKTINGAYGIKTDWATIADVSFFQDRFGTTKVTDLIGETTNLGTKDAGVKDITFQLDKLNAQRGLIKLAPLGIGSILLPILYAPHSVWDIKNSNDPVLGSKGGRENWAYLYGGQLIRYDAPGNINFGYVTHASGFSKGEVRTGAAAEQVADDVVHGKIRSLLRGDNSGDWKYIERGYDSYNIGSWFMDLASSILF